MVFWTNLFIYYAIYTSQNSTVKLSTWITESLLKTFSKVLRFYAIWDDTDSMFGECRNYIIHYYLMDDTIDIREVHERNDGRDPFPLLMNRQRIPKVLVDNGSMFEPVYLLLFGI